MNTCDTAPAPTVGRTVHYTDYVQRDPQAAIVTAVNRDGTVALKILPRNGMIDLDRVPFSSDYVRGHWTWPPRA